VLNEWQFLALPQEPLHAEWVAEKRVCIVLQNFRELGQRCATHARSATLAEFRKNVDSLENRAIFEFGTPGQLLRESSDANVIADCIGNQSAIEFLELEFTGGRAQRDPCASAVAPASGCPACKRVPDFGRRGPPARRIFRHLAHLTRFLRAYCPWKHGSNIPRLR